jgi:hypothetical protein
VLFLSLFLLEAGRVTCPSLVALDPFASFQLLLLFATGVSYVHNIENLLLGFFFLLCLGFLLMPFPSLSFFLFLKFFILKVISARLMSPTINEYYDHSSICQSTAALFL